MKEIPICINCRKILYKWEETISLFSVDRTITIGHVCQNKKCPRFGLLSAFVNQGVEKVTIVPKKYQNYG